MSLWTAIDLLRHNTTLFPRVEVKFDAASESTLSPILLHINPHLDLLFTGRHQRLRTISLRRLTDPSPPINLTYKDTILLSGHSSTSPSDNVLRRSDVSKFFGPTYPGEDLHYPGVSFLFDEDGPSNIGMHGNDVLVGAIRVGSPGREERHKEVKRIVVNQTNVDGIETDALDEVNECESMVGNIRQAIAKVPFDAFPGILCGVSHQAIGTRRRDILFLPYLFKTCSCSDRGYKCTRLNMRSWSTFTNILQRR